MDRRTVLILAVATALLGALWLAIASLVFVWRAGLLPAYSSPSGLRWEVLWAWWTYLGYDGPNAERAERLLQISAIVPLVLALLLWLVSRQRRPGRPLYGETRPATPEEMQDAGLFLTRKLRFWR
jgi:hypothetical protein